MSHANAALTPKARLKIARLIVDEHWPIARAAERYDVSWPTAKRWATILIVFEKAKPGGQLTLTISDEDYNDEKTVRVKIG